MKGEPSNQPRPGGALQRFLQGFVYAGKGICSFVRSERNARFHCLAIAVVTAAGFYFGISRGEWIAVVLCFGMVLAAEDSTAPSNAWSTWSRPDETLLPVT